jgi:murein DD-endopeptidase MepM/ murein hydrolase activator NlpD
MNPPLLRRIRVYGRALLVVVAVALIALVSFAPATGAVGALVDPVPAGVWPLQPTPKVVEGFDAPDSPWGPGHRGVDLAGAIGQVVHTALAGRVVFAASLAGRGVVVVDHGSTRTTYEPVAAIVRVGDVLERGQPIGTLELAGSHCFPQVCLHWGWKRGATYLDPLLLVGGGPIALLPWWSDPPAEPSSLVAPQPPQVPLVKRAIGLRDSRRTPGKVHPPRGPVWRRPLAMRPLLL